MIRGGDRSGVAAKRPVRYAWPASQTSRRPTVRVMNSPHDSRNELWSPCCGGEIGRLVDRLHRRRRLRRLRRIAGPVALLLVAAVLVYSAMAPRQPERVVAGMNCRETRQHAEEYIAGELDEEAEERVRLHLADCPSCEKYIEDLQRKSKSSSQDPESETTGQREGANDSHVARIRFGESLAAPHRDTEDPDRPMRNVTAKRQGLRHGPRTLGS